MKASLFVLFALFFLGTAFAQNSNDDMYRHPEYPHRDFLSMSMPLDNKDAAKKCYDSVHSAGYFSCMKDLRSFFMTHEVSVSPQCCSYIEKIEDACKTVIKYPNPFLKYIVSHDCSAPATPATPVAPAPAAPAPSPSS